jgi:chromosome segregation ATPase
MGDLQRKQQDKSDKKKKGGPTPEELEHRNEVVDLTWKHIEECENLEKRRLGGPTASARQSLLSGGSGRAAQARPATQTSLQDIDDPELEAGLQQLRQKDQEIDQHLDEMSKGVSRLKNIAEDMNQEVKAQNIMVDELTDKVDHATGHLKDLNRKLKETLEEVGGAQRIIVNVILLIIVLAIAAFAYKMVSDNNSKKK